MPKDVIMQEVLRDEVKEYCDGLLCDLISLLNGSAEDIREHLVDLLTDIEETGNEILIAQAWQLIDLV